MGANRQRLRSATRAAAMPRPAMAGRPTVRSWTTAKTTAETLTAGHSGHAAQTTENQTTDVAQQFAVRQIIGKGRPIGQVADVANDLVSDPASLPPNRFDRPDSTNSGARVVTNAV